MTCVIPKHTIQQHTKAIGDFLPSGPVFQGAFNTEAVLYKFLSGLAVQMKQAEELTSDYQCEFFPDETNVYLSEWESALGIPDDCFGGSGSASDRQRDIVCKILARGTQTLNDIQSIATKYGITVTIEKKSASWPWIWSHVFFSNKGAANTIYVTVSPSSTSSGWPWNWPISWAAQDGIIKCLVKKLMPAQTLIIFQ